MIGRIAAILLLGIYANAQGDKDLNTSVVDILKKSDNDSIVPNLQSGKTASGNETCTCVLYYLCRKGTINTNTEGIIDVIFQENPCQNYLEVCCNKEDLISEPVTPPPPKISENPQTCGYRNPEGVGFRITGDQENKSQFGEFPWMVAILREESVEGNPVNLNVYKCGGALIHPQVVLTGAHCVSGKNETFKIRAGEWDTQNTLELFPHQDREVQSISIHPQYYAKLLHNNIALLFLKSPVNIIQNVDVVCLPPPNMVMESKKCYATGWGKDSYGKEGKYQVILKKIELALVPRDTCQNKLRKTRLGEYFSLDKSFICAGGEAGKDTCIGDGGSPLVCPIEGSTNRYHQVGIVAWGIGCGQSEVPGVYVNVPLFRGWIDEQIKAKNLEISG